MKLFIIAAENRVNAPGFNAKSIEDAITARGQFAVGRGETLLNAFMNNRTIQGLPGLQDVHSALDAVYAYQHEYDMQITPYRNQLASEGINVGEIRYWKAVVQKGGVRSWEPGFDQIRRGRTDFSTRN
jgi:hypothetical protein